MLPAPIADLLICLRFFSRLPVPVTARETARGPAGLSQAVIMVPVAGAVIGLVPALVLGIASAAGLPPLVAAPLAIAALILVTGALHEDGLADCADGFGGGRSRDRKLEIMRDSRIGTFGACAVGLSLYLRAATLTVIAAHGTALGAAVLVGGAALSRTLALLPLVVLPPARAEGVGASAAGVNQGRYAVALAVSAAIMAMPQLAGLGPGSTTAAAGLAFMAAFGMCAIARHHIGGQTGDVAGATQQAVEMIVSIVFAGSF